jgi:hypothetical protein
MALAISLASGSSSAQDGPSSAEQAAAAALFEDGRKLMGKHQFEPACDKFAESQRLDPRLGTLLNLATCHREIGKTASAWAEFQEAAKQAEEKKQPQRQAFAQRSADELERELAHVVFDAKEAPEGLAIQFGDKALGVGALGSKLPIDPGTYRLEVTAPGRKPYTTEVTVEEGPSSKSITIPNLERIATQPTEAAPDETDDGLSTLQYAGLATGGAGVLFLGVSTVFGIVTFSEQGTVDEHCEGQFCDQEGLDADDSAHTAAAVSTVTFIAGTALILGGVAMFFWEDFFGEEAEAESAFRPSVGLDGGGMTWRTTF